MFEFTLNATEFIDDLRRFGRAYQNARSRAVKAIAREGVAKIVQRTAEPPIPHAKRYERTNRLISGWAPAGNYLGVPVPGAKGNAGGRDEGEIIVGDTANESSVTAVNQVPYALFVELTGTWIIPPPRQRRRAPYLMVTNTIKELESTNAAERHLSNEWEAIL